MPNAALVIATLPNGLPYVTSGYSQNYVTTATGTPHTQTQTNANGVCICAAAILIQGSGNVRVDAHAVCGSGTTGKTVEHQVYLVPYTAPSTRFTGGTSGLTAIGANVTPNTPSFWSQMLTTTDAGGTTASGILFNGVAPVGTAPGAVFIYDKKTDTLAGLLGSGDLAYDQSIIGNNNGVPFAVGTIVVVSLVLKSTNLGDVVTYQSANVTIDER